MHIKNYATNEFRSSINLHYLIKSGWPTTANKILKYTKYSYFIYVMIHGINDALFNEELFKYDLTRVVVSGVLHNFSISAIYLP